MRKKYEFDSQEKANDLLPFYFQKGEKVLAGANGYFELGHIELEPAVFEGEKLIAEAVLSDKWAVDVDWHTEPKGLKSFEVNPENPKHNFA